MIQKTIVPVFVIIALSINVYSQNPTEFFQCGDSIIDARDGETYSTVLIGEQCWMKENLNVGIIVSDFEQKDNQVIEKTCYSNDAANCGAYGGLYTWHEATQWGQNEQGICPDGWRLPSKDDWQILVSELGIEDAGQRMKVSKDHTPSWDGNNSSGFTAIPGGVGYENNFGRMDKWAVFWSSTSEDDNYAWFAQLDNFWYQAPPKYKTLYLGNHFVKENGFSVRCVR